MSATLAGYIIRKPGSSLGAAMLAVLIQFLMGNASGPLIFLSGLVTGLGAEIGFAIFRFKKWNWLSMTASVIRMHYIKLCINMVDARLSRTGYEYSYSIVNLLYKAYKWAYIWMYYSEISC